MHYVFEPNSFVPLMQARTERRMTDSFLRRPANVASAYTGDTGDYDVDRDPLFNGTFEPGLGKDAEPSPPLGHIHYYQCDQLGTPMELTDEAGQLAWEANYKAWGEARPVLSKAHAECGAEESDTVSGAVSGRGDGAALQPASVLRPTLRAVHFQGSHWIAGWQ